MKTSNQYNSNQHRKKNGQAAIEFLVTYGWAIMAAMIVIGALTYFGVTNPATSLPDKCTFSNGFECKDYQMNSTALKLKLINIAGQTVYGDVNNNITANLTDTGIGCDITGGNPSYLDPESEMEIICNNIPDAPYNTKEKAKLKLTINYLKTPTGYNQVALGEVYTTVQ
jgi:hypothetical protein